MQVHSKSLWINLVHVRRPYILHNRYYDPYNINTRMHTCTLVHTFCVRAYACVSVCVCACVYISGSLAI